MNTLVDDVGSFPLPPAVDRQTFNRARTLARKALTERKDVFREEFVRDNFCRAIVESFRLKLEAGLDVVCYPQHCDMHEQFAEIIHEAMSDGSYLVDEKQALIPEVCVISREAKRLCEETGREIRLRVCVTGPMELYLKEVGTVQYKDVLMMFSETVQRFAKKAILNSKYVKTEVVSLDEPSFGLLDIAMDRDTMLEALEKSFNFSCPTKQIHLHSSARAADLLEVKSLNVLTFEYAASPRNIESVSRTMLDKADKQVRVGVARTDIDSIVAELHDKGLVTPMAEQLVESGEIVLKRLTTAKEKYGDRMTFTGPDCGLGGWPTQEAAQLVLRRTVEAAKHWREQQRNP